MKGVKNVWVISPNVQNDGDVEYWLDRTSSESKVFIGYSENTKHGGPFQDKIKLGDIVLVARGAGDGRKLYFAGMISSERKADPEGVFYRELNLLTDAGVLTSYSITLDSTNAGGGSSNPGTLYQLHMSNPSDAIIIEKLIKMMQRQSENAKQQEIINLLKFKKQIILQGPPGTGKTKLAETIANNLIGKNDYNSDNSIPDEFIVNSLKDVKELPTVAGNAKYEIFEVNAAAKSVALKKSTGSIDITTFGEIRKAYKEQCWTKNIEENNGRRACAIAFFLFSKLAEEAGSHSGEWKIIQFHPSYTYEDFVRGIETKPTEDGAGVHYKAVDKVFGKFVNKALTNFKSSRGLINETKEFDRKLAILLDDIRGKIDDGKECFFGDKSTAQIIGIKEDGLVYNFPSRRDIRYTILFSDLEKVFHSRVLLQKPIDLRDREASIGLSMRGKYPYYFMLLQRLNDIDIQKDVVAPQKLGNYIFIIDEINRANLSAVLGELIYALEYRDKPVDGMYEVSGSNKLVLPPNLYIIGTMNTADRSVGYIDYAIQRRFAFVDVQPRDLSDELGGDFNSNLFLAVTHIFEKYVTVEFEADSVRLGHSYFIQQYEKNDQGEDDKTKPYPFELRIKYEIVPILQEYIKDGILKKEAGEEIKALLSNQKQS